MFLICIDRIQAMFFFSIFNRAACKLFAVKYSRNTCYIWNSDNRSGFQKKKSNNIESAIEHAVILSSVSHKDQ